MSKLNAVERTIFSLVALCVVLGKILAYVDYDFFRRHYIVEDGFIEWLTVVALLLSAFVCFKRAWALRKKRPFSFVLATIFFGVIFLFGAGEEVSWGQRMLGLESPKFFAQHNTQQETNLHNLVIGGVRLNTAIFSKGLFVLGLIYGFVITPLYTRNKKITKFIDKIGLPLPANHHILGYVAIGIFIAVVFSIPRESELTEFALSSIMFLNIRYPRNAEIFDPGKR